jgi:hypothetical protein
VAAALRPEAVRLVNHVAYVSDETDDAMCNWTYDFAEWLLTTEGVFDPSYQMTEDRISAYLSDRKCALAPASRTTGRSTLRRVRKAMVDHAPTQPKAEPRTPVQVAYTVSERYKHYNAAKTLAGVQKLEMLTLLDLTYGAGLQASEVNKASGSWIRDLPKGPLVILVPDENGEYREVPVFGEAAGRLRARQHDGLLLRPDVTRRHNVISAISKDCGKQASGLAGFRAARARSRWITDYMTLPVPFVSVCLIAGISAKSRTFPDLLGSMDEHEVPSRDAVFDSVVTGRKIRGLAA